MKMKEENLDLPNDMLTLFLKEKSKFKNFKFYRIVKFLKYIPILMILGGIGYGIMYWSQNYKDPYKCFNNEVYEQLRVDSDVYVFKGGYCITGEEKKD
jgi:hypothetical protein